MAIWKGHHYAEGQRLLREFSNKHSKSRWAAEADLHVGCYLTYTKRYDEARKVFRDILAKHPKGSIAIKAKIRLGNVAEQTGKLKEAVRYYGEVLQMAPTWDQFRYANFRARTLIPKLCRWQAMIDCGPTALASCLEALGKASESAQARSRLRHIL
jgi:tetratricopeptide (TPR) repeat protein